MEFGSSILFILEDLFVKMIQEEWLISNWIF